MTASELALGEPDQPLGNLDMTINTPGTAYANAWEFFATLGNDWMKGEQTWSWVGSYLVVYRKKSRDRGRVLNRKAR